MNSKDNELAKQQTITFYQEMYRTKHQSSQQVLYSQEIYSHQDHLIFREPSTEM